jgi:4-diphosphocytidyl-2-C-methyl-D-erythritol kinase
MMVVFPNAKINIGLNITAKRTDDFHNIESCFYPVDWCDALEVLPSEVLGFRSSGISIPGKEDDNLCLKAYRILSADFSLPAVSIHLLKAVPIGAGLGGGSADAAFTIKLLNDCFKLEIPEQKQIEYARRLGSDCAFFIPNRPAYCFGKGDEFEEIELPLRGYHILLVNPGIHISTPEAYSGVVPKLPEEDLRTLLKLPVSEWEGKVKNDFEATLFVKYPLLNSIKEQLYGHGAMSASMTGSGSTLYGIFETDPGPVSSFERYRSWQGKLQ